MSAERQQSMDQIGRTYEVLFNSAADKELFPNNTPSHFKNVFQRIEDATPIRAIALEAIHITARQGGPKIVSAKAHVPNQDLVVQPAFLAYMTDQSVLNKTPILNIHYGTSGFVDLDVSSYFAGQYAESPDPSVFIADLLGNEQLLDFSFFFLEILYPQFAGILQTSPNVEYTHNNTDTTFPYGVVLDRMNTGFSNLGNVTGSADSDFCSTQEQMQCIYINQPFAQATLQTCLTSLGYSLAGAQTPGLFALEPTFVPSCSVHIEFTDENGNVTASDFPVTVEWDTSGALINNTPGKLLFQLWGVGGYVQEGYATIPMTPLQQEVSYFDITPLNDHGNVVTVAHNMTTVQGLHLWWPAKTCAVSSYYTPTRLYFDTRSVRKKTALTRKRKLSDGLSSTSTAKKWLQIHSPVLNTDYFAGGFGSQILKLIYIGVPDPDVNEGDIVQRVPYANFKWRSTAQNHLSTIEFDLFDGNGNEHPLLQEDVVVSLTCRCMS